MNVISADERKKYVTLLAKRLRQIEAAAQLPPDQFEQLIDQAEFATYHPGDLIIRQGDPGDSFYFVLEGEARAFDPTKRPPQLLNYSDQGDFFGMRSLLYNQPRAASVDVVEDTSVAKFDRHTWEWLIKVAPHLRTFFEKQEDHYDLRETIPYPESSISNLAPPTVPAERNAAKSAAMTTEMAAEAEQAEKIEIAIRALSDKPTENDLLGFSDYAAALVDFIKNEKTEKPLTIGIEAAWGMGKTSLMKMIQHRLRQTDQTTKARRTFPTVWFNAWKYDGEEALWAALVLEILDQVRQQLSGWQRLSLAFHLNRKRFDWGRLQQKVLRYLVLYVFLVGILGATAFVLTSFWLGSTLAQVWQQLQAYVQVAGWLGFLTAVYATSKQVFDNLTGPFNLKLEEYLRQPNYTERVGFLAQFETDFKHVIEVVTECGKWPLVVFIDDLDRCEPPKPVEVIEAINLLLDSQYCVFILGMDAQTVAGSIEAKYKDMASYLIESDSTQSLSLGQRFLEKIIQINFRIPTVGPENILFFVDQNMAAGVSPQPAPQAEKVAQLESLIKAEQRAGNKSVAEAAQAVELALPKQFTREELTAATQEVRAKSFDDSIEVKAAIRAAVPQLKFNPRKIKRFINLFRLQALIANRRGLLEPGLIRLDLLGHWLLLATQWPEVIRAMLHDPELGQRLVAAHQLKVEVARLQAEETTPSDLSPEARAEKATQLEAKLKTILTQPLIAKWIETEDLITLLTNIGPTDAATFRQYLYLTQMSVG